MCVCVCVRGPAPAVLLRPCCPHTCSTVASPSAPLCGPRCCRRSKLGQLPPRRRQPTSGSPRERWGGIACALGAVYRAVFPQLVPRRAVCVGQTTKPALKCRGAVCGDTLIPDTFLYLGKKLSGKGGLLCTVRTLHELHECCFAGTACRDPCLARAFLAFCDRYANGAPLADIVVPDLQRPHLQQVCVCACVCPNSTHHASSVH